MSSHASHVEPAERDVYDLKVLEFYRRVVLHRGGNRGGARIARSQS